jgi:hypothetical protein
MNQQRNVAINKSQVAKQAKPLGELIHRMREAKAEGKDPWQVIPPMPIAPKVKQPRQHQETDLIHACLQWFAAHGIWVWRQNTGVLWAGGRPITYGHKGSGDISGILSDGRRLEVECKSVAGKQSDAQKEFGKQICTHNGVYLLIKSVKELEEKCKNFI